MVIPAPGRFLLKIPPFFPLCRRLPAVPVTSVHMDAEYA
jgi:hypothetical protein